MSGFARVLEKFGKPVTVHRDGSVQTGLAMVQPLFEQDRQWLPSPLGRTRQDSFLCLASPELDLDGLGEADFLEWNGQRYNTVTVQSVGLGNRVLYQWAVLTVREKT